MGSAVFFAVGDDFHLVSRVGQKLVVFGAAFAGAGFEASGAMSAEKGTGNFSVSRLTFVREKEGPENFLSFLGFIGFAVLPPYSRMC